MTISIEEENNLLINIIYYNITYLSKFKWNWILSIYDIQYSFLIFILVKIIIFKIYGKRLYHESN